ncbi:MAG: SPOR domain-containing protein [Bacteroidia bacterium]|nr:SPOR domain-containing protein [Bacteroidia bacterium]
MGKLLKGYVVLIIVLQMVRGIAGFGIYQDRDTSAPGPSVRVYAIQVAASKVYIDPGYFRQKLNLTEQVSLFKKDGWYKYTIGSYKTEDEAIQRLSGLKFDAFVTSINITALVGGDREEAKRKPLSVDSLPDITDLEMRRLYNRKIRLADSVYNIARDLLLARSLYQEATLIDTNKNYPVDQIIEIDKQLAQKQSHSIFSKLPLKVYVISGFAVIAVLVLVTVIFLLLRRKRP